MSGKFFLMYLNWEVELSYSSVRNWACMWSSAVYLALFFFFSDKFRTLHDLCPFICYLLLLKIVLLLKQ